ncbi:unnamed protein product, partial [marine sediment metagenome]
LSASVSRNSLALGETFNLIINANGNETNFSSPDVSPLLNNFTVLGSARNQTLNIVNNQITRKDQWIITLIPKYAGKLTIPSIQIGKDKTKPLFIRVATTQNVKTNGKQHVFIDSVINPKSPYINSEMIYQLRVYYDVAINAAAIIPPLSKNAVVKQLGQDQTYQTKIKGKEYQVFQRTFAVFPEKSGDIKLSAAVFRGQVADKSANPAYAGFHTLNSKPIQLIAPAVSVNVKPVPKNIDDKWWLPSTNVTLTEKWSIQQNQVAEGSPITRTVTLTAARLMASQLPPLNTNDTEDYNSYGGQPIFENNLIKGHLVAKRIEKFVYIPTKKSTMTIPAMKVKWWNVKTHQLETAIIPEKTFNIIPTTNNNTIVEKTAPPAIAKVTKNITAPKKVATNDWIYIAIALLLLWVLTLITWWFSRRRKKTTVPQTNVIATEKNNHVSLKQACLNSNANETKAALMIWAQEKFKSNTIQNLSD